VLAILKLLLLLFLVDLSLMLLQLLQLGLGAEREPCLFWALMLPHELQQARPLRKDSGICLWGLLRSFH
jgi:hypothetical protein